MKKLFLGFCVLTLFSFQGSLPIIKVYEKEEKLEKLQRKGFAVLILLEEPFVDKAWSKKLKEFGKVDSRQNEYIVTEAVVPNISGQPVRIYSKVTEKAKQGVEVWMAIDLGTEFITKKHPKADQLEQILYQFAVDIYRSDYLIQVEEAEKVLAKSTREYERTVSAELKIRNKIQRNKDDKKELLEKLKETKMDSIQLVKDLEMNKLEQKQDSLETIKMKKAVESVKTKMAQIK